LERSDPDPSAPRPAFRR